MVEVIFEESLPIFQLMTTTVLISVGIFIWIFYKHIRRYLENLMQSSSIIVCGPKKCGKTSLIKILTKNEVLPDLVEDLNISYLEDGGKKIQIVDGITPKNIKQLKRLNCKLIIYVLDPSPNSISIKEQIKDFEKVERVFKNVKIIPVINKIDIADGKKLNEAKRKIKKFYETSLKTTDGLDELKKIVLSSETKRP